MTPNLEYPGDTCCQFFEYDNWGGPSETHCATAEQSFHFDAFNDKTSSFNCGNKVEVDLCDGVIGEDCTGDRGITAAGAVRSPKVGHNDTATTATLRPYDSTINGAVTLFEDTNCTGNSGRFYAN